MTTAELNVDNEQARFNMVEQQIRTWDVLDGTVLDLFGQIPREAFVSEEHQGLAFADIDIPIGCGQTMLSPKIEGRILQAVELKKTDTVLEIGTGSGYLTALLASLSSTVTSVEIHPELSTIAAVRLAAQNIKNVNLEIGDAAHDWGGDATYDVIVYTGSLPLTPSDAMKKSLNIGGRMFVVVGEDPVMQATLITRVAEDVYKQTVIFETCLPELVNAKQPERFEF